MSDGGDKNVETTISKLEDTLRWRRSLDLYDLDKTAEGVKNEVSG